MTASPGESYPRFLPVGDVALTVEFGDSIDPALNARVMALDLMLAASEIAGITETVPAYRSLLICYDPAELSYPALVGHVSALLDRTANLPPRPGRRWSVPVAYGGQYGDDLLEVAAQLALSPEEVIAIHSGADYLVYLVGFNPGAPNLGGLPERLHIPRRKTPRPLVPAGSVAIGGMQSGITSIAIPTGWHLLGRTPVRPFQPDRRDPFLFQPGDRIRFQPIEADEFAELEATALAGGPVAILEGEA
ncbi:MAG: 5-oxoprolinase subunit PxpB [Rhodospirillales bacterium]|nr:5-oxoprolinase subunit PxpB [Rhodospirillales bacterium]